MRNNPMKTAFWQRAYDSLPAPVRSRYAFHMQAAERRELALDSMFESVSRAKTAIGRLFGEPRPQH